MRSDNSIKYADEEMKFFEGLMNVVREEYREEFTKIIRLSLIEAYRKGWNDADKFFDPRN